MAGFDYSSSFAGINNAINGFGKTLEDRRQRQTLADLGKQAIGGDYNAAAAAAFASGDAGTGLGLLKLGQTEKERLAGSQLLQSWGIGGSSLPAPNTTSPAPATPVSGTSDLIQNESGGNWAAQNNAVGAGGARGHFGRAQFGQARLQEAAAAGAIPQGTTPQQFMQSPELQKRAEAWHFGDIDNKIAANGFDRLVGQTINGVPITIAGLRNVAHLGGTQGMKRFIETGGRYNPSDANGTSLMDYLQMGARSSNGVRTAAADAPAPGAAYAAQNTGATGFAVPPGAQPAPAISIDPNSNDAGSRTFLQSQAMSPLAALGMAPAPLAAPQLAPQNVPMPPRRPADLAPSQPAEAAPSATAAPVQSVSGDDPAKLRADADYYERTNPEAARQLRARADAVEAAISRGSQPVLAQAAPAQTGMNGRTFDAISAGQPLDPAFKSEGVSQPWMGSALAPQHEAAPQVAAPLDPRADQTPGTGRPTQGFAVPQGQASSPSVTDDKDVRLWQDRYSVAAATGNERAMKIAEKRLEMATKSAERRYNEGKAPEAVREWQWARQNGMTTAKSPTAYAAELAAAKRDPDSDVTGLRKEVQQLPSYKNLQQAAPIYRSMFDTAGRNTKASDLNLVYGLGKIMDPTSVVREGEMIMVKNSAGMSEQLLGAINALNGGAALTPETRQALMQEAYSRMDTYRQQFDQDMAQYRGIVQRRGYNADDVIPSIGDFKPYEAPAKPKSGQPAPAAAPAQSRPVESQYVRPDGSSPPTPSAPAAPAGPRRGELVNGYRFKGGDAGKSENWVKVK